MSEAGVEELAMVAAGHAGDPGGGDVRADDGIPPSGGALEGGQLLRLAACGPGAAHDPPQALRPAGGPAHQVSDAVACRPAWTVPSWSAAACQAAAGSLAIACSSASQPRAGIRLRVDARRLDHAPVRWPALRALVQDLTRPGYTSDYEYCRHARASVGGQGSAVRTCAAGPPPARADHLDTQRSGRGRPAVGR